MLKFFINSLYVANLLLITSVEAVDFAFRAPVENSLFVNYPSQMDECDIKNYCFYRDTEDRLHTGVDFMSGYAPGNQSIGSKTDTIAYSINFSKFVEAIDFNNNSHVMGNIVISKYLMDSGEYITSVYPHLQSKKSFNKGDYIAKNQNIGIIGCSGNTICQYDTNNRHLHLELKKSPIYNDPNGGDTGYLWPYGYMEQGEANVLKGDNQKSITISQAIDMKFLKFDFQNQTAPKKVLIPTLSKTSNPNIENNYDVYGIAGKKIYGYLNIVSESIDKAGILARKTHLREEIVDEDGDKKGGRHLQASPSSLGGLLTQNSFNGLTRETDQNNGGHYGEGDYLFLAYANNGDVSRYGYPVRFSFVNDGDFIVDNDKLASGYSEVGNVTTSNVVPGYFLTSKLVTDNAGITATWKVPTGKITTITNYNVYAHIPKGATANVTYTINWVGDETEKIINQGELDAQGDRKYHEQWVYLGAYNLDSSSNVVLTSVTTGVTAFDAIKFEKNHSWAGNGSLIHHNSTVKKDTSYEYNDGLSVDSVYLHASTHSPTSFFQWQVSDSCRRLEIGANLAGKYADITFGSFFKPRKDDTTFKNIQLPFVVGDSDDSTDKNFRNDGFSWYLTSVLLKESIETSQLLKVECTNKTISTASVELKGQAIFIDDYIFSGTGSIISRAFASHKPQSEIKTFPVWLYGAFIDVVNVEVSSHKPVVFFQWRSSDACTDLNFHSTKSSATPTLRVEARKWNSLTIDSTSTSLSKSIHNSNNEWSIIRIAFDEPVKESFKIKAFCNGFENWL